MLRTCWGVKSVALRKALGNLEMPIGCEISVIAQEGIKTCYINFINYFKLVIFYSIQVSCMK